MRIISGLIIFLLIAFQLTSKAQLSENFNDGDFKLNPTWEGDTAQFIVNGSNQLQLSNSGVAASSYMVTPVTITSIKNKEWYIYVKQSFSGSASNYGRVYLTADQANLEGNINGYFLQFGEAGSNDAVELFRQTGVATASVCRGTNAQIATSTNAGIKVTCDNNGIWRLYIDYTGGTNYTLDATSAAADTTYLTSNYFGVSTVYTSTNSTKFFYDDILIQDIVLDANPPTISSATVVSVNQLDILFNEAVTSTSAQTIGNYSVDNGIGNPSLATIDGTNSALVHLTFASNFSDALLNIITINNIQDLSANTIASNSTAQFTYFAPVTAASKDLVISEIYADNSSTLNTTTIVGKGEFVEIYNRSAKNLNLQNFQLITGATVRTITSATVAAPGEYITLCLASDTAFYNDYGKVAILSSITLTNGGSDLFLKSDNGTLLDKITYSDTWYSSTSIKDGGYTLERINLNDTCIGQSSNWSNCNDATLGGTPGMQNSIYSNVTDNSGPTITINSILSDSTISICFNEGLDSAIAANVANYSINVGSITEVTVSSGDFKCVTLKMNPKIVAGTVYTITANNLADCKGNVTTSSSTTFKKYVQPGSREVIINEIYADNSGNGTTIDGQGEYVEIYNRSNKEFKIENWTLKVGTSSRIINSHHILQAGEYITLVAVIDTTFYKDYGYYAVSASALSLTNTGASIELYNSNGYKIDAVTYNDSWYNDGVKDDGGYSLERINPNDTCVSQTINWSSCNVSFGGTPGQENSILNNTPDNSGPIALSVEVIDSITLNICFNEPVDSLSAANTSNYLIAPSMTVNSAIAQIPDNKCVLVTLASAIVTSTDYNIIVSNITDCKGNVGNASSFNFINYPKPNSKDVVINEIYADNSGNGTELDGQGEFVEIYNRSSKSFSVKDWILKVGTSSKIITSNTVLTPGSYITICAVSDTDYYKTKGAYAWSTSTLSLTNSGTSLELISDIGLSIDAISYDDNWYMDAMKDDGGFSLERINPNDTCTTQSTNWRGSDNLTVGGTPSSENSIYNNAVDNVGPKAISYTLLSLSQIQINFSEPADSLTLKNLANYTFNPSVSISNVEAVAPDYTSAILNLTTPLTKSIDYQLTIGGITDCKGNIGTSTVLSIFIGASPNAHNLVINEIYADNTGNATTLDGKGEFIELYNRSNQTFTINNWSLEVGTSVKTLNSPFRILPGDYITVCSAVDTSFYKSYGKYVVASSALSLTNSGAILRLKSETGYQIDYINYNDSWYLDAMKDDGGFTLERVNSNDTCAYQTPNWTGCYNLTVGGTPSEQNSVSSTQVDVVGPVAQSAHIISNNVLELCFNEGLDSAAALSTVHYVISGTSNSIASINPIGPDFTCVQLTLAQVVDTFNSFTLTIHEPVDCRGNVQYYDYSFTIAVESPAAPQDLILNEIMSDPSPMVDLPEKEYIEIYNRSTKTINLDGYKIKVGTTSAKTIKNKIILPNSYVILAAAADTSSFSQFGPTTALSSSPSLNNGGASIKLLDNNDVLLDEMSYTLDMYGTKQDGGWSLERVNPDDFCSKLGNWIASTDEKGGTPGKQNSVYAITLDNAAPKSEGNDLFNKATLRICFDESLDSNAVGALGKYAFTNESGGVAPSVIFAKVIAPYYNCLYVYLSDSLIQGNTYKLTINSIADCKGNASEALSFNFGFYRSPKFNELIITEMMVDPSPIIGLPETKYIEVYNKTNEVLSTQGMKAYYSSYSKSIPTLAIQPQSYVLFCKSEDLSKFPNDINKLGFSSFIDPSSSGTTITLADSTGKIINTVSYTTDWYRSTIKDDGGWALEMIDFNNPCGGKDNWKASDNALGGTPGKENSVKGTLTDLVLPELYRAYVVNDTLVRVYFSESLDSTTLLTASDFVISEYGSPVAIDPIGPAFNTINLILSAKLTPNKVYTLTVGGTIKDCIGNVLSSITRDVKFSTAQKPALGDVIINELLYDAPTDGADFVELYNLSSKVLDLKDLALVTFKKDTTYGVIDGFNILAPEGYLFFPGDHLVVTDDAASQSKFFYVKDKLMIVESNIPSYSVDSGHVALADYTGKILDVFNYNNDMKFALLSSSKGVSLERINYTRYTNEPTNWHSAAESAGFATPGYKNSQFVESTASPKEIAVEPEIFSPDQDGFNDVTTIKFRFENPGNVANIIIFDANGRQIKRLKTNELLPIEGEFSWDGTTDANSKAPVGAYIIYFETYDLQGNVSKQKLKCVVATKL